MPCTNLNKDIFPTKAILAKAFRGEFARQNPEDKSIGGTTGENSLDNREVG